VPGAHLEADVWITEYVTPCDVYHHGVTAILAHARTTYQEMYVVESPSYGKALVLDGKWQSCTGDEFLYHEPLVHPACVAHGAPRQVLILGGGEGATLREVLKWRTVRRAVMVDIDGEVVEACRKHLPEMHQGAFDDPRAEVVIADAVAYIENAQPEWDVIISDLSDPIEEGPSFKLFTREYFEKCRAALAPGGYFVLQAGPIAPHGLPMHACLAKTLESVHRHVASYGSPTSTYGSPWGFLLAGGETIDRRPDPGSVDNLLRERTTGVFRMFDGTTLLGLLNPPRHIREAIRVETRVYTLAEPPKFFGTGVAHPADGSRVAPPAGG
jgi:spermidine synthase